MPASFAVSVNLLTGAGEHSRPRALLPMTADGAEPIFAADDVIERTAERLRQMHQQVSVITLGVDDLARSKRFYGLGFGWTPVFENDEIVFYQMNGVVLSTFLLAALGKDMGRTRLSRPGAFVLAHSVAHEADVAPLIDRLAKAGGTVIRKPDVPPHGGFRGYVADPDDHAWEIAWNPAWPISPEGYVTWGA